MPQVDAPRTAGILVAQNLAAANTVTVTLDTPPTGMCTKILWIACYATAATAADVHITKAAGTSICRLGGVGTSILNSPLYFGDPDQARGGVPGYAADGTLVVLTTTAGTNTECTVGYTMVPA